MTARPKNKGCNLGFIIGIGILALLLGPSCSGDYITGIWVRVTSLKIKIKEVKLRLYSEDSTQDTPLATQTVPLSEAKTLDPESENPENQLWILVTAKEEYKDKAIFIRATGLRNFREVAYGSLEGLQFIPDKIIEATNSLDLSHSGSDEDEDGFYVPEDCDDQDPNVHPEAQETCNDGLDNNCDGTMDEGCPCESGTTRECWPHWAGEIKGGICHKGHQTCDGTWGSCGQDLVLPNPEACPNEDGDYNCFSCTNGIDDDCDGFEDTKDTDCGGCVVDTWEACFTGPSERRNHGICKDGQRRCVDGSWGLCEGEVLPNGCEEPTEPGQQAVCKEISEGNMCDGRDNDCDEIIDNVTSKPSCSRGCGVCSGAKQNCIDGQWADCSDSEYENYASDPDNIARCNEENPPPCCSEKNCYVSQETTDFCDGLDNDCDCVVDNAVDGECICNNGSEIRCPDLDDPLQGVCKRGVAICENGDWVDHECRRPETEICDGLDNNCDGTVDQHPNAAADCMQYQKPHTDNVSCVDGICRWECQEGFWDLNNDRNQPGGSDQGDGCEYECTLDSPANELCDDRDNDCDGLTNGDDQVNIDVLCPPRPHSGRTRCEGPYDCDYTCIDPFEDCNDDLDDQVSTNYQGNGCEINLSNDRENCGSCGFECGPNENCSFGSCECGDSGPDCDDTPSNFCCGQGCVDKLSDVSHCGDCATVCSNNHGSTDCISGVCSPSCNSGWGDCDNDPTNGCDTYLWSSDNCGTQCSGRRDCTTDIQNASGTTCNSGSCDFASCNAGYGNCDDIRTNGCEENIWETTDCGTNCDNRVNCNTTLNHANGETCSNGHCSYSSCEDGFANCNNNTADGCEENIWETTDCGTTCNNRNNCNSIVLHASGVKCSSGQCDYTSCDPGYLDCNGNRSDGCEKYIWSNADCATSCSNGVDCDTQVDNASGAFCDHGLCNYSSCTNNYGDCNGNRSDGCEVDLNNSEPNCGSCNFACTNANGTTLCIGGTCVPSCNNGSADCDGYPENGCEENIWQPSNCGTSCATIDCFSQLQNASGITCPDGTCAFSSCVSTYDDCDSNPDNGCETDLNNDTDNCGGCDVQCTNDNGTTTCSSGNCYPTCSSGFSDCDSNPDNGCETDLRSNPNCGSCNNDCSSNASDKACVNISGNYVCGCNNSSDCGGSTPTCTGGLCE